MAMFQFFMHMPMRMLTLERDFILMFMDVMRIRMHMAMLVLIWLVFMRMIMLFRKHQVHASQ